MSCIICDTALLLKFPEDSNKENDVKNKAELNKNKFILHSFCRYFNIKLPLSPIQWDLNTESLPFCLNCKHVAATLVRLNRKLEILKSQVAETENLVRSKIVKICSNTSSSGENRPKAWRSEDSRIQSIRDIIVGPCLKLKRVQLRNINPSGIIIKEEPVIDDDFSWNAFVEVDFAVAGSSVDFEKSDFNCAGSRKHSKKNNTSKNSKRKKLSLEDSNRKRKKPGLQKRTSGLRKTKDSIKSFKADPDSAANNSVVTIDDDEKKTGKETHYYLVSDDEDKAVSDISFGEDPADEDSVLSDDGAKTVKEDRKLSLKLEGKLRCKNIPRKANRGTKIKFERLEDGKYSYAGFEYCGSDKDGYKCFVCTDGHVYPRRRNIQTHMLKMHLKAHENFLCPICGKELKRASLKYHMESHDDSCIAICEVCGKECRGTGPLKQHVKLSHMMESKLVCEVCGKKFKANSNLNHHMKAVHLKEKNVFCEICGKGFYGSSYLTHHMKGRHATEKQFSCNLCGQRFVQKGSYTRHMQQFHSPSSVPPNNNNQPVRTSSTSYQHQNHQEDSNLRCKYCGLQYNRQNNLTRHLLQIHHINVKGLAWKHKAPRKILEKVYLQPQPDLLGKHSPNSQLEPDIQGTPEHMFVHPDRAETSFVLNSVSSIHPDEYSSASSIWDRGFNVHPSNT